MEPKATKIIPKCRQNDKIEIISHFFTKYMLKPECKIHKIKSLIQNKILYTKITQNKVLVVSEKKTIFAVIRNLRSGAQLSIQISMNITNY